MLAIDRQRKILSLLQQHGTIRTADTAETLGVTDETVRKDFELLEKRGELLKIHGGASLQTKIREDLPFTQRQGVRREEKQAIAKLAASRILPNETIFLDASSTVLTLLEFLPDFPLTILTNALNVITALNERPNIELICTGGVYDAKSKSFTGVAAETMLKRHNIHRMFLSGNGLHPERGVSESNSNQAAFKERVIANAEDVVFLADSSKLGQKASFFFATIADLTCLVTDTQADPSILLEIENQGVEVCIGK